MFGVESVEVTLNQGLATIQLKAGNTVGLERIHQLIRDKGFTPRDARVSGTGVVTVHAGKPQVKIAGEDYEVQTETAEISDALKQRAGETIQIEGVIPAPIGKKPSRLIRLKGITEGQA